jgi:ATP-binding cassette subfamily C protein CydD
VRPVDPRLLRQTVGARQFLTAAVVAGIVGAGLVLLQAQLLAHGISHAGGGWTALRSTVLLLVAVVAGRAVMAYVVEVAALRASAQVRGQLRHQLAAAVLRGGPAWTAQRGSGELVTLATRGLDATDSYFARYLPQLVLACVVPVAVLARVAGVDLTSALVIAVTLPLIPVFMILIGLHTRNRTAGQWRTLALLGGHFLDVVQGLPTLTVFGRARAQATVIRDISERNRRATMETLRVAFLSALVLELLATLSTALVAVEVGLRLLAGRLPYETALLVLLLAPEAFLPLRAVGAQFHASMEGAVAVGEVLDLTAEAAPIGAVSAAGRCDLRHETVELAGVSVAFPGRDRPAIDDLSLSLAPGEHLVIRGASGAGKSTLLAVLLRLTEPTAGTVTVGGRPVAEVDLDDWRRQLTWVPQSPYLLVGSVADNIRLGRPGATDAQVAAAAALAGLDLPGGLATQVAENGGSLSSGQRQRVALARAFVLDAAVVLLDEPTAHLAAAAAADIRARVGLALAGRTLVVVTHDPRWTGAGRELTLAAGRLSTAALVMA